MVFPKLNRDDEICRICYFYSIFFKLNLFHLAVRVLSLEMSHAPPK